MHHEHTETVWCIIVVFKQWCIVKSHCIRQILQRRLAVKFKRIHPNKTVSSFALGSKKLYDYINDNPAFAFLDPHVIRRNNKMIAINSAIEIDITGQVCSDSRHLSIL